MADTEATKIVESTVEEKKVEEKEKVIEKEPKEVDKVEENGGKVENGDSKEEPTESEEKEEAATDKCSIKRKSTGDAVDGKGEEVVPEKKTKVDAASEKKAKVDAASAEAEANGEVTEAEAAA